MSARYKFKGGDKLLKHLKTLPDTAQALVREVIAADANALVAAVRAEAPVYAGHDPRAVPGALRAAIRARFSQKGLYARVGIFAATAEKKAARAAFLTSAKGLRKGKAMRLAEASLRDVFYARFVEFGTVKMKARPFLFPTFRAVRRAIRGNIVAAVNKALRRSH